MTASIRAEVERDQLQALVCVAAVNTGRQFIGIERDETYNAIAEKRFASIQDRMQGPAATQEYVVAEQLDVDSRSLIMREL
jgi:hypothetical protein